MADELCAMLADRVTCRMENVLTIKRTYDRLAVATIYYLSA